MNNLNQKNPYSSLLLTQEATEQSDRVKTYMNAASKIDVVDLFSLLLRARADAGTVFYCFPEDIVFELFNSPAFQEDKLRLHEWASPCVSGFSKLQKLAVDFSFKMPLLKRIFEDVAPQKQQSSSMLQLLSHEITKNRHCHVDSCESSSDWSDSETEI